MNVLTRDQRTGEVAAGGEVVVHVVGEQRWAEYQTLLETADFAIPPKAEQGARIAPERDGTATRHVFALNESGATHFRAPVGAYLRVEFAGVPQAIRECNGDFNGLGPEDLRAAEGAVAILTFEASCDDGGS